MKPTVFILVIMILMLILVSCSSSVPAPLPAPTSSQTSVPPTDTPIPTATPTQTPEPTATPTLAPGNVVVREKDSQKIVYIPGGEFTMGFSADDAVDVCYQYFAVCDRKEYLDEEPPHQVRLDPYWIDQTEVTFGQYAKCMEDGVCQYSDSEAIQCLNFDNCDIESDISDLNEYLKPGFNHGGIYIRVGGINTLMKDLVYIKGSVKNQPVVDVNWDDARIYCEWAGGRLPTEAEWEFASRGDDGRVFPWGNEKITKDRANFDNRANKEFRTKDVGSYPSGASPFGVLDMTGNVSEWVADFYQRDYYSVSPVDNPSGPEGSNYRVIRGGSWFEWADFSRTTKRFHNGPTNFDVLYGFRCAMDVDN